MPSVVAHPALQIKGYNPYVRPTLNSGGAATAFQPSQPAPAQEASFMATGGSLGADQYVSSENITRIQAHNVNYRVLGSLNIKVPYAQLDLTDRTPEDAMHLEGLDFNLHLKSGQVRVSDVDLSLTIGSLLDQNKAPVKDVRVVLDPDNRIRVEGKVSKFGLSVPFKVNGTYGATPEGHLRYDLGKVSVMGIPVQGVMKTFGLTLEKVLKLNDPAKGFHAVGNSVMVNPNAILAQPGIHVNLREATSHVGDLVLTFGSSDQDLANVRQQVSQKNLNALQISGGHFYYDGYFVKDGKVRMEDKTPHTPLQMDLTGETIMNLRKGFVGVTEPRFSDMITAKLGDDSSLKNASTRLNATAAELKGSMWGAIPLKLDLAFGKTASGQLMFTPGNAKAFGFVPLPDSLIRGQVQKMVDGGIPYEKGVALPSLGDTELGTLRQVAHQKGFLILEAGNED
ncbi:MAG: hypothetical protein ACO1RX_07840 [Candidatus Sericytochromatia bacterium]